MKPLENVAIEMLDAGMSLDQAERAFRKAFISEVLMRTCGNQCEAAEIIGIHRNTLGRSIGELEISIRIYRLQPKRAVKFVPHQEMRA